MRIFLSFNSKDAALAEAIGAGLAQLEPAAKIFFSPTELGSGFWMPKLDTALAEADAFLLLIGPNGMGPWQAVEYAAAFDRHVNEQSFVLVPVMAAGAQAPGLLLLRTLNWVEAPVVTENAALHQILAALKGEATKTTTPLWKLINPYRGLEAMTEANADYFYGRGGETSRVLDVLAARPDRLATLVGASGVGKSSVAQAGVLAALKAMRWPRMDGIAVNPWPPGLAGSRAWVTLVLRPGEAPLETLAASFVGLWGLGARDPELAALPRKWAKGLASGDNKLADLVSTTQEELKKRQGDAPARVLLYLDQGEELYTRSAPNEARRFSEVLSEGLRDPRLCAFASLRADYFDRFQADEPLFKCREHIDVPPLDRGKLEQVVTAPAAALGASFEDDKIAGRITDAAAAEPGALPLLSYLLTDMWANMVRRGQPVLGLPAHAIDAGSVLATRAEGFVTEHPAEEAALRRLLTLRLAIVPPEGEPVRRQTSRDECSEAEWALAARLADYPYRLVVMGEREADRFVVAEVAHEALLRAWPRLVQWLREEREFLIFKGEAERAARRWHEMGNANRALLAGLDLARAEEWLPKRPGDLSPEVMAYIQRSITEHRAVKEKQFRFQRRVAIGAIAAALLMAIVGAFAWVQWGKARQQTVRADTQLAEAERTHSLFLADLARQQREAGDAGTALVLALAALPNSTADTRPYVSEAEVQLDQAYRALREQVILPIPVMAFSPDFSRVAVATMSDLIILDLATQKAVYAHTGGSTTSATFSSDGKRIVTASFAKTARVWDAATGKRIAVLAGHTKSVSSAAFNPDGTRIVTASDDKTARVWDAATGKQITMLVGHKGTLKSAAFSPNGTYIVTASADLTARVWNVETTKQIAILAGHDGAVNSAAFSPDGKRIVTVSGDKTARIWDAESGEQIAVLVGHTKDVSSAAFSSDGKRIVTASEDKTVRIWNAVTGKQIAVLLGHTRGLENAAFSPDGKSIISTSLLDFTLRFWDAQITKPAFLVPAPQSAAFSPDGMRIVTASYDKTARVWDAAAGKQIFVLAGHEREVQSAEFSPDGKRIVTASDDKTARIWDAATGKQIVVLVGHESGVYKAAFSYDGKRIVTASDDKTARIWDAATGKQIVALVGHESDVSSAAFSPDGQRVVTASWDDTARLWDAVSGKQIGVLKGGMMGNGAAFSPDGRRVVMASGDRALLWDAASGRQIAILAGHAGEVLSAAFNSDGTRIVTASDDKTARIWDAATGKQIAVLVGHGRMNSAVFSPDGTHILTASLDNTIRLWPIFRNTQEFLSAAKTRVPRCLTADQRTTFFLPPEPPAWCIEMKKWPYQTDAWQQWLADERAGKHPPLPR